MPKTDHRVMLTATKVSGLKPAAAGQRYQVMDALVPGFGVRVTDSGNRTYILRTRFPGANSPSRREIGKCADMTLTEARDRARLWRDLVRQGIDPVEEAQRARTAALQRRQTTFGAVAEVFIRDKLPGERKGKDAEREIRRDLLPKWCDLAITEVTDLHVTTLIKTKGRDGKVGARNLLALIKRFFRWVTAQPEFGLSASPCANIRATDILGEMPRSAARILTNDELFALWRAAKRMPYPVGPAYQLLCLTALRLNEAVDASWSEFNMREKIWIIPAERMKGKDSGKKQARAHAVPLTPEILAVLDSLPRHTGRFLFSTSEGEGPTWIGSKIKQRLDRRMLRTLRALARHRGEDPTVVTLPPFVNHDIRRTVRSQLSRLRVTEEAREAVLAHARPGIKGTYDLHDYFEEKREALELWHVRLSQIVRPSRDNVVRLLVRA
ncbi:integrase arm-type DNA-binding domain-containing protein [Bradyrhizobium sp. 4]|uniref:tyrosine-type recombinase/integrase n=1 Tax=unclassified Bradyrhizobium TaxID=2631580 RepID=UPI001FFAE9CA|nr:MULTISPECIES: site-specific integrase [unclassified Bradyrhizobium]MCK1400034.1 integrase arm-type DNA-binding domain-containing protein [Bradyrhizobium sp. 39]MCK1750324.1 integrase arm-type DNA-binding domain-containing protein [Bradyrhizobium sp. 135]UPJ31937.1 integrase arm-type DNA-binding domain-containing protein [Bradyrhizobium sp. 4]